MKTVEEWFAEHKDKMSKEELLDKKLSDWAGKGAFSVYPTGYSWEIYTESLDACFEDLCPKLFTWNVGVNWELQSYLTIKRNGYKAQCDLVKPECSDTPIIGEAIAETPALALCLAIEKVIDNCKETA